nr:immunoglobulin heavy chain junction region [Macaca mulatta]MOX66273.1 immunoglobulin heavy chain junction region [Macaca mulatta]
CARDLLGLTFDHW